MHTLSLTWLFLRKAPLKERSTAIDADPKPTRAPLGASMRATDLSSVVVG